MQLYEHLSQVCLEYPSPAVEAALDSVAVGRAVINHEWRGRMNDEDTCVLPPTCCYALSTYRTATCEDWFASVNSNTAGGAPRQYCVAYWSHRYGFCSRSCEVSVRDGRSCEHLHGTLTLPSYRDIAHAFYVTPALLRSCTPSLTPLQGPLA